jgi:glycosyltransferase involved in cell wall biosynthesis
VRDPLESGRSSWAGGVRILHVVRTLAPRTGGPATVVRGLAAAQAAAGHQVTVLFEETAAEGIQPLAGVQLSNLAEQAGGRRALEIEVERLQPDVLHLHGVWCRLVRRSARLAKRQGRVYVVSPHGALGRWSLAQKSWKKQLALALVYRALLRRARALVATNEVERQELIELGFSENTALIPHGLSAAEVELAQAERSVHPTILFLSRLTEQKDPLLLLNAFELVATEHPDVELTIAGPDDGLGARVTAQVELLPAAIRRRVHLPGPIYGSAKRAALRSAWVLCLPSRYESFGAVLIEALAQETPVVCSVECGFPEIARAGAGASVERNREALARALRGYLDPAHARAAGALGRQFVVSRHLWPALVERYVELYRGAAPDPRDFSENPVS